MTRTLPQQQLLLELLIMSGEIAVPDESPNSILWRTLRECRESGWLSLAEISPGIFRVAITPRGRQAIGKRTGETT